VNVAGRHTFTNAILFTWLPILVQMDSNSRSRQDRDDCPPKDSVPVIPRVILADDQKEMLRAIVLALRDEFSVVGIAENGTEAIDLTTRLCPDVLVLDICMPVENGITAACHLKDLGSKTKVIFLTVNHDPEFVAAAMSAGALGYVLKQSLAAELVPAIWSAIHGNVFISPSIHSH
jgi:DNA-binding NarL/FixJ family response regulator